jgi:DNA-binding SARP family transcriptional activator
VRMLGPFEVEIGGELVTDFGGARSRALFQYLVLRRTRCVPRETLMELLWPGYPYQSARNSLNVALYALRARLAILGERVPAVVYTDGCYRLNQTLSWQIDADVFTAALAAARTARATGDGVGAIIWYEQAVGLYRGPLFESEPTEQWSLLDERSLQEDVLLAAEELAQLHVDQGDLTAAARVGLDALRHDPCRESLHRLLMRCYARQHQRHLVCRQFRDCGDLLRRTLDLDPADETTRLYRELVGPSRSASSASLSAR